jgi:hypothetical protein
MPRPRSFPVEVLWCSNARGSQSNGWKFPRRVRRFLMERYQGKRVLHLFGGRADFGVRIDIDPIVRPDVVADAWLPPFRANSFDVVVLDPPYLHINQQMKQQLLRTAAELAIEEVVWFHTMWVAGDASVKPIAAWLVRVGDSCACRCIQIFKVSPTKAPHRPYFTRGPAMKYNRWIQQPQGLPFGENPTAEASA